MLFINPQWQGSGITNELKIGAETLKLFFKDYNFKEISLYEKDLESQHNIIAYNSILKQAEFFKTAIIESKAQKIQTVGGDCGIEIIPISYLNEIYKNNLGIIWIDAHADLNTPESSPSKTFHGMPLRTLLGEGNEEIKKLLFSNIKPQQICFVGLRDLDEPEIEYIKLNKIQSVSKCDYAALEHIIKLYNTIYIHLDLDVLDESEFKYTMFPTSNGFKIDDVYHLIKEIKQKTNVVGMCITESKAATLEQLQPIKKVLEEILF
ncbi:arginase family protein [Flavobacterium sp. 3-218]